MVLRDQASCLIFSQPRAHLFQEGEHTPDAHKQVSYKECCGWAMAHQHQALLHTLKQALAASLQEVLMQDFVWKKDSTHCRLKGLKNPLVKGMAADASNLCTWEAEAGELRALESMWANLVTTRPCLRKTKQNKWFCNSGSCLPVCALAQSQVSSLFLLPLTLNS